MELKSSNPQELSAERTEDEPKLKFKMFFSDHAEEKDVDVLREEFKDCDIFMPENAGHNATQDELLHSLSQGTLSPEEFAQQFPGNNFPEFALALGRLIYGSKKPILFNDIPFDHPILKGLGKNNEKYIEELKNAKNFDDVFDATKNFVLKKSELNKQREEIIVESMPLRVRQFLSQNPTYRKKGELKVLVLLGNNHTTIWHKMRSQGLDVSRKFSSQQKIFGAYAQIQRAILLGKEVTKDMIARRAFIALVGNWFSIEGVEAAETQGVLKVTNSLEILAGCLNYDEIRRLFEGGNNITEFKNKLKTMALVKKLQIPEFLE